jgi:hypothetical protein
MRRQFVFAIVFTLLSVSPAVSVRAAERGELFVIDHALSFSASATDDVPAGDRLGTKFRLRKPVILWTKIGGTAKGLERIRRAQEIPIRHRWSAKCGVGQFSNAENAALETEWTRPVGTTRAKKTIEEWDRLVSDLRSEIVTNSSRGLAPIFDWRTLSKKEAVGECHYLVRVTDENNSPLYCEKLGGECLIEFSVIAR